MILVHIENVVGWSLDHLLAICEDNRLKNIDHLGNISHLDSVAVLVENIEVDTGNKRISDCVLLIEESRICAWLAVIPGAPFIYNNANLVLFIILIHDCLMLADKSLHEKSLAKCSIPLFLGEIRSTSLVLPSARMCIVMKGYSIHETMKPCR